LTYNFNRATSGKLEMFATAYQLSNAETPNIDQILSNNLNTYTQKIPGSPNDIAVFDYRQAIVEYNISYIASRDLGILPKFYKDPLFSKYLLMKQWQYCQQTEAKRNQKSLK
jgi:hypothetical protein